MKPPVRTGIPTEQNDSEVPKTPSRSFLPYAVAGVCVVVIIGGIAAFRMMKRADQSSVSSVEPVQSTYTPSPTPFPFQELTIPYLRNRTYKSAITRQTQAYDTQSYTAYLTAYSSDNLTIDALLTIPKTDPPEGGFPAVVFIHGYIPPADYNSIENYYDFVDYLARNGLVVCKINLRGHGNSEGDASGAYYSGDYIIDTLNAYSALQQYPGINSSRVYLWGHSMAGNVVMRSLAAKPDIPKAVIWAGAVYTYVDMREFGIQDSSYRPPGLESERKRRREELYAAHGEFDSESEYWKQVVPTNYLDGIAGEIHIHHAENDPVVSVGYSRNLSDILDTKGIRHTLYIYPTGGHNLTGSTFNQAMARTVEFFTE